MVWMEWQLASKKEDEKLILQIIMFIIMFVISNMMVVFSSKSHDLCKLSP